MLNLRARIIYERIKLFGLLPLKVMSYKAVSFDDFDIVFDFDNARIIKRQNNTEEEFALLTGYSRRISEFCGSIEAEAFSLEIRKSLILGTRTIDLTDHVSKTSASYAISYLEHSYNFDNRLSVTYDYQRECVTVVCDPASEKWAIAIMALILHLKVSSTVNRE